MLSHTPGPWYVAGLNSLAVMAGERPDQDVVCHIDGGFEKQYDANARLIAAAPELLEALEKYTHCRHGCIDCFCTTEARAAIRKAKEGV